MQLICTSINYYLAYFILTMLIHRDRYIFTAVSLYCLCVVSHVEIPMWFRYIDFSLSATKYINSFLFLFSFPFFSLLSFLFIVNTFFLLMFIITYIFNILIPTSPTIHTFIILKPRGAIMTYWLFFMMNS